jgi:hypothetical protein
MANASPAGQQRPLASDAPESVGQPVELSTLEQPVVDDEPHDPHDNQTQTSLSVGQTAGREEGQESSGSLPLHQVDGPLQSTSTEIDARPDMSADQSHDVAVVGGAEIVESTVSPQSKERSSCIITLLMTSGTRHPYRVDERYLTKRNVEIPGVLADGRKDPFSISVYTLKELILREWRAEWELPPSSPSYIRLIHFGRLLDDKAQLRGLRAPGAEATC